MKKTVKIFFMVVLSSIIFSGCAQIKDRENIKGGEKVGKYTMPDEKSEHEGTWLQWPHEFTYGKYYKEEVESIWI